MKHIGKGLSPALFEDWKGRANDDWQPTYECLQKPEKSALHFALLAEQGFLCCYCGRRTDATDSHVEHFRPQERYPELALEFRNLHASCIRETKPGKPVHCGHAKGSGFDQEMAISPLETECEQRFLYTAHGVVEGRDEEDRCADYMIGLLKLNESSLIARRRAALNALFDLELAGQPLDVDELDAIIRSFNVRNDQGLFPEFGHVVSSFAVQLLRR